MKPLEEYRKKRRFGRTAEPRPKRKASRAGNLFVVQKHRATQLHYDFRLEVDEVLKSWSVPKGPSLDPSVKRSAIAVEDHPLDYADFEGVIPADEYGGGTVMVWDRGTYEPEDTDDVAGGLRRGRLKLTLKGRKLNGSWVLVRIAGRRWLLFKHRDRFAASKDIAVTAPRSVLSGRTLARIAADEGGRCRQGGDRGSSESRAPAMRRLIRPMLATPVSEPFDRPGWVYEEKYDGDRTLAYRRHRRVRLYSRNLNDRPRRQRGRSSSSARSQRASPARATRSGWRMCNRGSSSSHPWRPPCGWLGRSLRPCFPYDGEYLGGRPRAVETCACVRPRFSRAARKNAPRRLGVLLIPLPLLLPIRLDNSD
jgi:DNA ligase D-like protein (predicted 3'-phosphoesterase)